MGNGFKFLKQVEGKTNQFEIGFYKSFACFGTHFRVKESFKLLKFGDKSRNSLATAKLTNHSAHTNLELEMLGHA